MKKCVLPFRQFVVHWDGVVDFCCNDFGRDLVIGDIRKRTVEDMWWGKEMTAIRAMLRHGDRRFAPCYRCNYFGGMRQGCLPPIPPATPEQKRLLKRMLAKSKKHYKQDQLPSKVLFAANEMKG